MRKEKHAIQGIPAVLWGDVKKPMFIAVHGNMSCKEDIVIERFAYVADNKGYCVLSFDLPEHGERSGSTSLCTVQNCVRELRMIYEHSKVTGTPVGIFGCSIGAYFSLLAYKNTPMEKVLFLSPVVNMKRIIDNMMMWFGISEERLQSELMIETPIGQTLYWEYYQYVVANPVESWMNPTSVLYGAQDTVCERDTIDDFVSQNTCSLDVMEDGEHHFHTEQQLVYYEKWLHAQL